MSSVTKAVLGGSLLLNVILALVYLNPGPAPGAVVAPPKPPAVKDTSTTGPGTWSGLDAADFVGLGRNLRSAGFPPEMIRAILSVKINATYAAKRRLLDPQSADRPFWKSSPPDLKLRAALRALTRETANVWREAAGPDADNPIDAAFELAGFGPLSEERARQVREVLHKYGDSTQDILDNMTGSSMLPADRARFTAIQNAQHEELAKILSPSELEAYDLRTSPAATNTRLALSAFNPTESEFLAFFRLQQAFDAKFGLPVGGLTTEENRQVTEGLKKLYADFAAGLSPERAADFNQANNYDYRMTTELVSRLQLPSETANRIWQVQQDTVQQAEGLRTNKSMSLDQRRQQTSVLLQNAEASISKLLGGGENFSVYKQYGGRWYVQLAPKATKD